jgi:hypothetical protein
MKARIVKFGDLYAIELGRKRLFGGVKWLKKYRDLQHPRFDWPRNGAHFRDCLADLETIEKALDPGCVVREVEGDF